MYNLYYTFAGTRSKKLTKKESKEFVNWVNLIDQNISEAIFMLIIEHATVKNDYQPNASFLPYDIAYSKKRVQVDIEKLPSKLQQILFKFYKVNCENEI